jgi:hypothetical protein
MGLDIGCPCETFSSSNFRSTPGRRLKMPHTPARTAASNLAPAGQDWSERKFRWIIRASHAGLAGRLTVFV